MEVLLILLVALGITAVVGHGIWVCAAWLIRGGRSRHDPTHFEPTKDDDRAATLRHINHLLNIGAISEQTHAQITQGIAEESRHPAHSVRQFQSKKTPSANPASGSPTETPDPSEPPPVSVEGARPVHWQPLPAAPTSAGRPVPVASDEAGDRATPEPPRSPAPQRRPWSEILASFMAEKNIRWGELIGGLLIVGSSIALVISLWSHIQAIPVLKFVIFTAITTALFGVGLFVYHRWNIPTTGHAVLLIATLLVPLNLLAFAAFSLHGPVVGGWTLGIELIAVVLFGWLTLLAAGVLTPDSRWLFAGSVAGLSTASIVTRFVAPLGGNALWVMGLILIAIYICVTSAPLVAKSRRRRISEPAVKQLYMQLGVVTFSCLAPLGLIVYESGLGSRALHVLSPLLCAFAIPALLTGSFAWRRIQRDAAPQLRTTAAGIALVATGLMLTGVGLAWPDPSRLMPAIIINAIAAAALSRIMRHPWTHATLVLWCSAAWILAAHLLGDLSWSTNSTHQVLSALMSARSGQALVAVVAVCMVVSTWLRRRRRRVLPLAYGASALTAAILSIILVTRFGFARAGDPAQITWVYVVYAVAAFWAARKLSNSIGVWCGCVLGQMAIVQLFVYAWPIGQSAWPTALLIGASTCSAAIILMRCVIDRRQGAAFFDRPLACFAASVSFVAATWLLVQVLTGSPVAIASRLGWTSGLWAVIAFLMRWPWLFGGAQVALAVAMCTGVSRYLHELSWYQELSAPRLEPWIWQVNATAVGVTCLIWEVLRLAIGCSQPEAVADDGPNQATLLTGKGVVFGLLNPRRFIADRWITNIVLAALIMLAFWSVLPGIGMEHGWGTASLGAHAHAAGVGAWALSFVLVLILGCQYVRGRTPVIELLIILAGAAAFFAARFEQQRQITTAIRWLFASLFVVTSVAVLTRRYWTAHLRRVVSGPRDASAFPMWSIRVLMIVLFVAPVTFLTLTFAHAAGWQAAKSVGGLSDAALRLTLLAPAGLIAVGLIIHACAERRATYALFATAWAIVAVTATELSVRHRASMGMSYLFLVWLAQINALVSAVIPVVWQMISSWRSDDRATAIYPRWPLSTARAVLGSILFAAVVMLFLSPAPVPGGVAAAATWWGILSVIGVELACVFTRDRQSVGQRANQLSAWACFGAVLLAGGLSSWDTGNWLCYHALMVAAVVGGWTRLGLGAHQIRQLLGPGWSESVDTACAQAIGQTTSIDRDLSCSGCDYNLRGLTTSGRCPECGADVATSIEAAVKRLTPQWAGQLGRARTQTVTAVMSCVLVAAAFSLRAYGQDPQRPWWSVAVLIGSAALCMALAVWAPRRALAYAGGAGVCLATTVWWMTRHGPFGRSAYTGELINLVNLNVIALAIAGLVWLGIERRVLTHRISASIAGRLPTFHRAAAAISCAVLFIITAAAIYRAANNLPHVGNTIIQWVAWSAAVALVAACRRDPSIGIVPVGLYSLGLAAIGLVAAQLGLSSSKLAWVAALGLAGYVFITTLVWRRYALNNRPEESPAAMDLWLVGANGGLAVVSVLLALFVSFKDSAIIARVLVATSPLILAAAASIAAFAARPKLLRAACLGLLSVATVCLVWSPTAPGSPAFLLHRTIGIVTVASLIILTSSLLLGLRRGRGWAVPIAQNVAVTAAVTAIALLYCCGFELHALTQKIAIPLSPVAITMMIVGLLVIIVSCIGLALHDRLDPLHLSARWKEAYVYTAEILAAILVLHVRSTMPWLFSGVIARYWPLLLMGLAFAAVGAGELFARQGRQVFARPLGWTGTFLPAFGMLEIFLASSVVSFSIVLLTAGALYAVLAGLRRSMILGVVAAASLTGSLWHLLYHIPALGLTQHPQLWFIPPALAMLAAGHLNRDRLSEPQRAMMHYVCLLIIYLSSTADIFLIGVAQAPWLPLVLMALSLSGIASGVVLRVRSFLFVGTGFLCLSLLTIIWHAATNLGWTWLWYVSGIALGIAIITAFALLEKKRSEIDAWIARLREWSG